MRAIRWDELPEARQLARLGEEVSRGAERRFKWMLFYFFNGRNAERTCRHFGISNSETLRRTRCGFPVGRCGSASSRHLAGGSPLPGGAHRAHAVPHRGVPGGWRERVRRGIRGSLPAETNSPIRAAAAVSETERTCGAVQSHA